LNIKKCTATILNKKESTTSQKINEIPFPKKDQIKYLGVHFNLKTHSWNTHIQAMKEKVEKIIAKSLMYRYNRWKWIPERRNTIEIL
jgi:hypothetical protein